VNEAQSARAFDRRVFALAAILFPALVLAGFARTYYFSAFFDAPSPPSAVVHLHGLLMTAWVGLFVTQVWLVSSKRVWLHRRLGIAGVGLGTLIVPTGVVTALRAAKYGSASTPAGVAPLAFLIVPTTDLVVFVALFGAALYYRRQPANHKRLMLLTAINFVPPALARIPIASLQALGPLWFFGLPTVLTLLWLFLDTRRHGLNTPALAGMLLLLASYPLRLAILGSESWLRIAGWLTSYV
jgi:hypothetical protein